jgi:hypothetical protein
MLFEPEVNAKGARDAWQGASRYDIVEHLIGGRRPLLQRSMLSFGVRC